ncbi:MAG: helix-turn-helix domain-containing protein, partial [Actinobacteria bacterium]|nr:helix-turn-helix domain-containing protein [Actinomycetota bacterium]
AATASHLSRSVFYQRLALIEELLGVDLGDGETQAALHVAVLTRPRSPAPERRGRQRAAVPPSRPR